MIGGRYTPGPWNAHGNRILSEKYVCFGAPIATVHKRAEKDMCEANASLIAAAPELLEALDKLAHYAECQVAAFTQGRPYLDMTLFPSLCRDARTAIAKATGSL